jgi:integrase
VNGIDYLDEVDRRGILRFDAAMRDRGLANSTIARKHWTIVRILKCGGLDTRGLFLPHVLSSYQPKPPSVYTPAQIERLFASADMYERVVFEILLKLGLRKGELESAAFLDVSFDKKVFRVHEHSRQGYRDIPIPDDLLVLLGEWRALHPAQLPIVPNSKGEPNRRFAERLQRLAHRAGLACGTCRGCQHNRCAEFTMHKFRRTCIIGLLRSGMDTTTSIQPSDI